MPKINIGQNFTSPPIYCFKKHCCVCAPGGRPFLTIAFKTANKVKLEYKYLASVGMTTFERVSNSLFNPFALKNV